MDLFRSVCIAFSMYSRLPVPRVRWDEGSMRYVLLCFPLVGAAEGLLLYGLVWLLCAAGAPELLRAALLTVFPILYTGGIHMDGFMDTADALGSWKSREERLQILKDVHAGSFAVLSCVLLLITEAGAWTGVRTGAQLLAVCAAYPLSRCGSALSLMLLPNARGSGSAYTFSSGAVRNVTVAGVTVLAGISVLLLFLLPSLAGDASGGPLRLSAAVLTAFLAGLLYSTLRCTKTFGGMTGDLAGFLLTVCELCVLIAAAVVK